MSKPSTPIVTVSTRDLPQAQRYDLWQYTMGALFDVDVPTEDRAGGNFNGTFQLAHMGGMLFGHVDADAQLFTRSRQRVAGDGMDHILVQVFLKGGGHFEDGTVVERGDLIIIDLGRPHARHSFPFEHLTFLVPRDHDPQLSRVLERWHDRCIKADAPLARMLFSQMSLLWQSTDELTAEESERAALASLGLFHALAADGPPSPSNNAREAAPAMTLAIKTFIDQNLAHDLSPDRLAAQFRMSRSHLYRLFARDGGVGRYVQERRLRAGFRMLQRTPDASINVMAVAQAVGFKSDSHFSRAIKAQYGATPSDIAEAARAQPSSGLRLVSSSPAEVFQSWVKEI